MKRIGSLKVLALFVVVLALQTATAQAWSHAVGGWSRVWEGIEYATGSASWPRAEAVYALRVSLRNPEVWVYASHDNGGLSGETTTQTTPAFAIDHGLKAAVNANFFVNAPYADNQGLVISNGTLVSPWNTAYAPVQLLFTADKVASIAVNQFNPSGIYNAVCGSELLLSGGQVVGTNPDPAPRTVMGLSQDGKYLIMLAIDGGASSPEQAQWLLDFGAWDGCQFDGGGSTCMALDFGGVGVVNNPTDGSPRAVGTNLGAGSSACNTVGPSSVSWDSTRVDIIARGAGNNIFQKAWSDANGCWGDWRDLGGGTYDTPAVCSWAANRLDLFVRGTTNQLYHLVWNGEWHDWVSLGGSLQSGVSAACWDVNRIDVVGRGASNDIVHYWWNGSVWNDDSLGGATYDTPGICSWESNRLDVFVRGTTNHLFHKVWDGQWHTWADMGGSLSSGPAVTCWGPDRIDVVAKGSSNDVVWRAWNAGSWSGWYSLGGPTNGIAAAAPCISTRGSGQLDLFVRGTDDHLYQRCYRSGSWGAWLDLGAAF